MMEGVTGRAVAELITKAIQDAGSNMDLGEVKAMMELETWQEIQWCCKTDPERS